MTWIEKETIIIIKILGMIVILPYLVYIILNKVYLSKKKKDLEYVLLNKDL